MRTRATFGAGNGATAPGSNPVAAIDLLRLRRRARSPPGGGGEPLASTRLSPGTSASTGRPSQTKTRDFTISLRLQPTALRRVAGGRRPVRELLHAGVDGRLAQDGGDALDRLRPRPRCDGSERNRSAHLRRCVVSMETP